MVRAVTPIPFVKARFFDRCGKPLAGGKVYTYFANTTTPKVTYKDPYGLTPNTNPIVLDAAGEADIYLDGTYRIRITDRNDVLINDVSKIGSWFSGSLQDGLDNISLAMDDAIKPKLEAFDGLIADTKNTADVQLADLQTTIDTAKAAGAGAKGWTTDLVEENGLTQKQINAAQKTKNELWIDVTDKFTNDPNNNVAVLNQAIADAKAQSKGIRCAPRATVNINADVDFSGVRYIDFRADINIDTGKQIIYGGTSTKAYLSDIYFKSIGDSTTNIPSLPMLKLIGVKQCNAYIGACNYMQLIADTSSTDTSSTAYNNISFGGIIRKLEITNIGDTGWVNENHFYNGRIVQLAITGNVYYHNGNYFHNTTIEGASSTLAMSGAWDNHIRDCRMEALPNGSITFDANTFNNIFEKSWNGSGSLRANFTNGLIGTNLGRGNIVAQKGSEHYDAVEVFSITPRNTFGNIYESSSTDCYVNVANEPYATKQLFTPNVDSVSFLSGRLLAVSDLIPVDLNTVFNYRADYDGALLRMYVQCFDANRNLITTDIGAVSMYLRSFVAASGYYLNSSNLNAAQLANGFAIESDQVKFVRVGVLAGSAGSVRDLSCRMITVRHGLKNQKPFLQKNSNAVISGGITQGFVKKATKVFDTLYKSTNTCLFDYLTNTSQAEVTSATSITLRSAIGVLAGDIIGIQLSDGTTQWTEVASISGNVVTLKTALTNSVNSGAVVVFNRWSIKSAFVTKTITVAANTTATVQTFTINNLAMQNSIIKVLFNKPLLGLRLWADLSADNTVTVYGQNTTASSITTESGSLRVVVE